jgi:hypothetical protein
VTNLSGEQSVTDPIDASGEDVSLISDDIQIDESVRSPGADIVLSPLDTSRTIVIGDVLDPASAAGTFHLDMGEMGNLQNGFNLIVIGSDLGNHTIQIGDASTPDGQVTVQDTLVLNSPMAGGEININDDLTGGDDASLVIYGSGNTTTFSANASMAVDISIADSVEIDGDITLVAGTSGSGNIELGSTVDHYLRGNGDGSADQLTLTANNGNITVTGEVGAEDPLEAFTITEALDVTFDREVAVNGDLIINASGTVTFSEELVITGGDLIINGAASVVFESSVEVGGNILLEGDEIDFNGGNRSVSTTSSGTLILRPATVTQGIEVASPPEETTEKYPEYHRRRNTGAGRWFRNHNYWSRRRQ